MTGDLPEASVLYVDKHLQWKLFYEVHQNNKFMLIVKPLSFIVFHSVNVSSDLLCILFSFHFLCNIVSRDYFCNTSYCTYSSSVWGWGGKVVKKDQGSVKYSCSRDHGRKEEDHHFISSKPGSQESQGYHVRQELQSLITQQTCSYFFFSCLITYHKTQQLICRYPALLLTQLTNRYLKMCLLQLMWSQHSLQTRSSL